MEQTVALVDLFEKEFLIPHYQRGYRWEAQEVNELLDDLWSFEKTSNKGEFYCLQPIVLQKNNNNCYSVLDGQQRLTTLYLIITFLEDIRTDSGYNQKLFILDYATRKKSRDFLEEKNFVTGINDGNIDYYHITQAYQTIKDWFANPKHAGAKMKLVPILMDKNDKSNRNVRFIWYEAESHINPIEVFIRLNVGKIPLTDAELTKALLLQSDKYLPEELRFIKLRLFELASEWDSIEYTLQSEEFWYFLNNQTNERPAHIEFIFDLIADKILKDKKYFEAKPIKHATFLIMSEYLQDLIDNEKYQRVKAVEKIWQQVTQYFDYFRDWFQNRTLYHYIGFLVAVRGSRIIDLLIHKSNELSKKSFVKFLEIEIGKDVAIRKKRKDSDGNIYDVMLENLSYENEDQQTDDRKEITKILLLHNVYATLKSEKEKARFPFNLYKQTKRNERWSLEHIHAQNSESITKIENQKSWLNDHIKSLSNHDNTVFEPLVAKMKSLLLSNEIEKDVFDEIVSQVYKEINLLSGMNDRNMHLINNLCLVDSHTNSQLNNSVFDVKREIIKKRELAGFYIPICTRNVFLKAYTAYPINNAYWTNEDRYAYFESIKKTVEYFVNPSKVN